MNERRSPTNDGKHPVEEEEERKTVLDMGRLHGEGHQEGGVGRL